MATTSQGRSPELTAQQYIEKYRSVGYCFWAVIDRQRHIFPGLYRLFDQQGVDRRAEVERWRENSGARDLQERPLRLARLIDLKGLVSRLAPENIPSQYVA